MKVDLESWERPALLWELARRNETTQEEKEDDRDDFTDGSFQLPSWSPEE